MPCREPAHAPDQAQTKTACVRRAASCRRLKSLSSSRLSRPKSLRPPRSVCGRLMQLGFNPGGLCRAPGGPDKQSRNGQASSASPPASFPRQKVLPRHCPVTRANPQLARAEPDWIRGSTLSQPRTFYVASPIQYAKPENAKFPGLQKKPQTATVAGSTLTPGPIVEEMATL